MAYVEGAETDAQRMEREWKQKEEADTAAGGQFPPPPPSFAQYMQFLEENRRKD